MSRKTNKNPYLFSDNERVVLENIQKHNTPLELSTVTKIPRPTVYITLEKLETRNLIHSVKVGKKRKWLLIDGINTHDLFTNQKITKVDNLGVKIYTEKNDIIDVLDRLNKPSKDRLHILSGEDILDDYDSVVGKEKIIEFNENIKTSKIIVDMICTRFTLDQQMSHFGDDWAESYIGRSTEVHVIDKKYLNHNRQIFIYNGRVYFFMLDKPAIVEISDKNLVRAILNIFEFFKDNTPSFDMNGYLKNKLQK